MSKRPPVEDWGTDFDHRDPRWVENPYPIWDELRRRCPVAHSTRFEDGAYFASRYEEVRAIAYDSEHFSSRRVIVRERKVPLQSSPPITSDPPEHTPARKLLLPAFTPQAIAKLEPGTRAICRELLERIGASAGCDAAVDYAQHIPVRVIAHMLGVPEDDGDRFREWIHLVLEVGNTDESVILPTLQEMNAYFAGWIERRRAEPGDDLISFLLKARVDGAPLALPHFLGTLRLLLIAGIDTTWSAIGASLWHLATHPADRRRLAADRALLPTAVEEFLRAYAPVTMAREVAKQAEVGGCTFREKGQVLLSFPAANRDPAVFPDADKVLIDRTENRHAAFGLGRHRCLGSNLARMELTVALDEWLARLPEFRLADGARVRWSEGTVRGPRRLPVAFPGARGGV
ncbi:MAG TPA: cytochrome P450 [Burkholderiales bacterium]|nr:cytochrome P450 [Burkholderiales bacterium]